MPGELYTVFGNPLLFADSAQAEDATLTMSALASLAGQYSAQLDRGAAALPAWFEWFHVFALTGTNILNALIEIYIVSTQVSGRIPGGLGTTTAALTAAKKANLGDPVGFAKVDQTTTNTLMYAKGYAYVPGRYITAAIWNATTLPYQTSTSAHQLYLTPLYQQVQ